MKIISDTLAMGLHLKLRFKMNQEVGVKYGKDMENMDIKSLLGTGIQIGIKLRSLLVIMRIRKLEFVLFTNMNQEPIGPLPGENPLEMGAFIDNIQLTDCYELIPLESQTIDPGNDAFELTDINNGMYWLKMKAKISNQWFNFSLNKSTLKAEGLKPEIIITQFNKTDNAYRIDVSLLSD